MSHRASSIANALGTYWFLLVLTAPRCRDVTGTGTNTQEMELKSLWMSWHQSSMGGGCSETPWRSWFPPQHSRSLGESRIQAGTVPAASLGPHTRPGAPFWGDPAGEGAHTLSVLCLSSSVLRAISKAPSRVRFPPMKPLAWTKTQPGIPASSDSASSRSPRQASGRGSLWGTEGLE